MAADADKIVIAGGGTVYGSPTTGVTITAPTAIDDAVDSDLVEFGYVSPEGVRFHEEKDTAEIRAWQAAYPVRRLVTSRKFVVSFDLMEWKRATIKAAFGGGTWTETTADTEFSYTPPDADDLYEMSFLIDFNDGTRDFRLWVPRAIVVDFGEVALKRDEAAVLPLTIEATSDGTSAAFTLFSDDVTAFNE
jgi:hypothetical protein